MVTVIRNNRNLLSKRDNYFQRDVRSSENEHGIITDVKKLSEYDRKVIQKKIKEDNTRLFWQRALIFGITMSIFVSLVIYLLFFLKF